MEAQTEDPAPPKDDPLGVGSIVSLKGNDIQTTTMCITEMRGEAFAECAWLDRAAHLHKEFFPVPCLMHWNG